MTKYPSYVVGWQKELAGKFPHYSSFVTTKLKKGNVDPLANENGFDNCARVLRGRYAFYMGRQRAWQHSPSPFVPKGMTSQPKIVFEFFDRDVQPDFGALAFHASTANRHERKICLMISCARALCMQIGIRCALGMPRTA